MVAIKGLFSGFAVRDVDAARAFYTGVLGLSVTDAGMGNLAITLPQGGMVLVYPKPDHVPATYTMLNLEVADIDAAVDTLTAAGVAMQRYGMPHQDAKGVARGKSAGRGPDIAWFLDPSGNILSVLTD